ncbi:hypothetical protein [Croceitalea vernalis]|uniref:Uncharacterized protein n=1 Tax=Croceitalea vernalis TaxID=3075599 RepID=A0ABU3BIM9_9FLAO|nr:hypothetical protein [Croceitalea sp. P007]MDT0622027.1 hypothetical protein [Croceitalea sp. P007]
MIPSFVLGFIGAGFGIYAGSKSKDKRKKPMKFAKILFGQCMAILLLSNGISWTIRSHSRAELRNILNEKDLKIVVDGANLSLIDTQKVISELKSIEPHFGRKSYELTDFKIGVSSKSNSMKLMLRKDRKVKNRYWIFWNKYVATSQHEIGKIKSNTLSKTLANI